MAQSISSHGKPISFSAELDVEKMSTIDELTEKLRETSEKLLKSIQEVTRKTEEKVQEVTPGLDTAVKSFASGATEVFKKTLESSSRYARKEQVGLLSVYRRFLVKQLELIDARIKTLRSKRASRPGLE